MRIAGLIIWMLALLTVLQQAGLDLGMDHALCGPWGCGPPLGAILACRGFWLVPLAAPAVWFGATRPSARSAGMARLAGLALAAVSLLGLGAIAVHEAVTWAPGVTLAAKPYLDGVAPRRIAMIFAQRERFCCRRLPSQ